MIHPGLIPTLPPPLRGTATNQSPRTAPPTPTGTWAVWGTGRAREKPTRSTGLRPGSPLGKRPGAAPSIYAHKPCLRQWGRSLLPLSRVLSCWGPRPPGQQSAARPSECLSHHGFVRLLQHLKRYVCPRVPGVGSRLRGFAGGPGKGSRPTCRPPPPPENGGDPSDGPSVPRRQVCPSGGGVGIVRSSCSFGTHMASPFSFLGRRCCVKGRAAGGARRGGWERVLCWDEALYLHIFLWEREPGSSVALPPSVASSAQGPSASCLPSGVPGFGLRFGFLPFPLLSPPFPSP